MKEKLNTNHPDEIIEFIKGTEFAGMVTYDKVQKRLILVVEGIYVYFDPLHCVLEIKKYEGKKVRV